MLKPQDILVALQLATGAPPASQAALASALELSASEVNAALKRLEQCNLGRRDLASGKLRLIKPALLEFLSHGLRFVFPARPGELTRGLPTAGSAPPLRQKLQAAEHALIWPHPQGDTAGLAITPLYRSVPAAAASNAELHELLALADALRLNSPRLRSLATEMLQARLQ